jgi:hypothetical protein
MATIICARHRHDTTVFDTVEDSQAPRRFQLLSILQQYLTFLDGTFAVFHKPIHIFAFSADKRMAHAFME